MESGIYTITDKGAYNSDKFSLSHEDNTFTIQLSTLTYNNVEQISYAYSINGEDWRTIQSGMNELSFSHMPAGTYKFRVKAICNGYETLSRSSPSSSTQPGTPASGQDSAICLPSWGSVCSISSTANARWKTSSYCSSISMRKRWAKQN